MLNKLLNKVNLNASYLKVKRNKGAGGVDGLGVNDLQNQLQTSGANYLEQISKSSYQTQPILGVEIPKPNGKKRLLGIPTVVDRVFQQALQQVLSPIFEPAFEDYSYGFRPNRNAGEAIAKSLEYINSGKRIVIDIDLKNFFDEINHDQLLSLIHRKVKCKATLKLLRSFLRAPIQLNGKLHKRNKGVPQGSPLSPLLSNIYLNELDKELKKRGHKWIRYADDFSIYVSSDLAAKRVMKSIVSFIEKKLKLPINREKSGIRKPHTFTILGHSFVSSYKKGSKGKYQLVVSKGSWQSLKSKLKLTTRKTIPMSFDERISRLNKLIRGWVNYFKSANIYGKLKQLDEWLRNRLRYCIWHHWKKPERKRKNLIRLGIKQGQAYAWSRTRMGGWAVAQSPILGTTITIARLKQRGYLSLAEYYKQRHH